MSKTLSSLASLALCVSLAACGSNDPVTDDARVGPGEGDGTVGIYADGKAQEVGSERIIPTENILNSSDDLLLEILDFEDFKRMIGPEKGCSFRVKGESNAILIASTTSSNKTRPKAIVRMGGEAIMLTAVKPGSYGYLAGGPEFRSENLAIEVTPVGGQGTKENTRTIKWDANVVVRGAGDMVRVYRGGEYSCDF